MADEEHERRRRNTRTRDECPKCGALSYQGGYCFRCGTYRPSKHNTCDEERDAASFMDGSFGERLRVFYAETDASNLLGESEETFNPNISPSKRLDQKPRKKSTPQSAPPSKPPRLPVIAEPSSSPPAEPELSIAEKIDRINLGLKAYPDQQSPMRSKG